MPAKSEKQRRFMAAVANNPKFAKKVGVPKSVGEEFMKTKKYQAGGAMASSPRPRMRPEDLMGGSSNAPRRSPRPKARPKDIEDMMSPDTAVGRGNRAAMREAEDMRTLGPGSGMKKGGKVKEYGGKETYKSKAAMMRHEAKDSPAMERKEGMASGGKVRGYGKARGAKACKMC